MTTEPLTLMLVHAHPDDETFSTGGAIGLYHERGVRVVNVTCTGGERGEIVDPELATPSNFENLAAIRRDELAAADAILELDMQEYLGFYDSGMAGTEANADERSFHQATLDEATHRLVRLVRRYRPQVLVTYDEGGSYGHPDHIKAHLTTVAAFDAAGNPERYPDAGEPWQPTKLYFVGQPRQRMLAILKARQARGEKTWLDAPDFDINSRGIADERITTELDVTPFVARKVAALRVHRTQVVADHPMLRDEEMMREYMGREFFVLARGDTDTVPETDLFAGV